MRVVRAQLNNGQRVIGVRYPQMLIALAEKAATDETRLRQQLVMISCLFIAAVFRQLKLLHFADVLAFLCCLHRAMSCRRHFVFALSVSEILSMNVGNVLKVCEHDINCLWEFHQIYNFGAKN